MLSHYNARDHSSTSASPSSASASASGSSAPVSASGPLASGTPVIESTIALKGMEHYFSKHLINIIHTFTCSATSIEAIQPFMDINACRSAWTKVLNRHPRMRCLLNLDPSSGVCDGSARIVEEATMEMVNESVEVRFNDGVLEMDSVEWDLKCRELIKEMAHQVLDYSVVLPFRILVIVPAPKNGAGNNNNNGLKFQVMICSAHHASDGFSGIRVFHDFMSFITCSASLPSPSKLSLLPSLYDRRFGFKSVPSKNPLKMARLTWVSWIRNLFWEVYVWVLRPFIVSDLKAIQPLLGRVKAEDEYRYPFKEGLKTGILVRKGEERGFVEGKKRCKGEGTTLHGGIVAAITIGYHRALSRKDPTSFHSHVSLHMDIDYNCRRQERIQDKTIGNLEGDHVGMNMTIGALSQFQSQKSPNDPPGVSMDTLFWDHARDAKKWTDETVNSFDTIVSEVAVEVMFARDEGFRKQLPRLWPETIAGDVNLSNMGPYPFDPQYPVYRVHDGGGSGVSTEGLIQLDDFFVFNNFDPFTPVFILYMTCVKRLCYSLAFRADENVATEWLDDVMKVVENLGSIGEKETLLEVEKRLFL
ncbi:hypothetical protein HDU76_000301 [Blyttiomyces sp. JEL0837]|nr:hypothetical protein HDU76_000301 [Blyttiomyces sp. JEL0837]